LLLKLTLKNIKRNKELHRRVLKNKAVELSYSCGGVVEICTEFDIPTTVLSQWQKKFDTSGENGFKAGQPQNDR